MEGKSNICMLKYMYSMITSMKNVALDRRAYADVTTAKGAYSCASHIVYVEAIVACLMQQERDVRLHSYEYETFLSLALSLQSDILLVTLWRVICNSLGS
jgi:hypothetical protein